MNSCNCPACMGCGPKEENDYTEIEHCWACEKEQDGGGYYRGKYFCEDCYRDKEFLESLEILRKDK